MPFHMHSHEKMFLHPRFFISLHECMYAYKALCTSTQLWAQVFWFATIGPVVSKISPGQAWLKDKRKKEKMKKNNKNNNHDNKQQQLGQIRYVCPYYVGQAHIMEEIFVNDFWFK